MRRKSIRPCKSSCNRWTLDRRLALFAALRDEGIVTDFLNRIVRARLGAGHRSSFDLPRQYSTAGLMPVWCQQLLGLMREGLSPLFN